ncbi:hypothetical protein RIR_jg10464.t1 [Rhizophagus irregularis DAOM 181602=DAOM 197198]|nr:hypothetical protein RIR_jg10464.t1 [Rhizophagus irregularis DAOM 181602=DAOM 197198]
MVDVHISAVNVNFPSILWSSLITASLQNNISRAEKIDEYFKIMVFNNREWLKVTDQPISKPGAYDGFL